MSKKAKFKPFEYEWKAEEDEVFIYNKNGSAAFVATFYEADDAKRAVICFNAMRGIANPADFVNKAKVPTPNESTVRTQEEQVMKAISFALGYAHGKGIPAKALTDDEKYAIAIEVYNKFREKNPIPNYEVKTCRPIEYFMDFIKQTNPLEVEIDSFDDKSSSWIEAKYKDGLSLTFSFNYKGSRLTNIAAYKDVVEVVDHKRYFKTNE